MRISPQPTSNQKAFTLIEILVVLAILAGVTGVLVNQIRDTKSKVRVTMRKLSVITRSLHDLARLKQKTFRLAIQIEKEKGHSFWVESGTPTSLLKTSEQLEKEEKAWRSADKDEAPPSDFSPDKDVLKTPVEVPKGLRFEDVELPRLKNKIDSGMAYVHFFPQGLAEEAAIHLTDGKDIHWTIYINPLTGVGTVIPQYSTVKDARAK